jgi:hypothetical protein
LRGTDEREAGLAGLAAVILAGHAGDEEGHHLVSDELVDYAVMGEEDARRHAVEALKGVRELRRGDLLPERGGTPDVGEEDSDIDQRPARVQLLFTVAANVRILAGGREARDAHEAAAQAVEGARADLAAGSAWQPLHHGARQDERLVALNEVLVPRGVGLEIGRRLGRHRRRNHSSRRWKSRAGGMPGKTIAKAPTPLTDNDRY